MEEKSPLFGNDWSSDLEVEEKIELKRPPRSAVILLNDDYTPMEFVIWLLQTIFQKSIEESTRLMLDVHTKGRGICGVYPYDIAQTKAQNVRELAKEHGHPLECIMEAET